MKNLEVRLLARSGLIIGVLLALVVGNLLFYGLGVANLDKLTRSLKDVSAENKKKLATTEAEAESLAADVGRIASGRSFLETLAQGTLKTRGERLVMVQEEVSRLMKDAGLTSDQLSYAYDILPPKTDTSKWRHRYLKTTLQLAVTGSYPQVKNFIRSLQNSPHFFVLENMAVTSTQQGTVVLHANLLVSTFFIATETDRAN